MEWACCSDCFHSDTSIIFTHSVSDYEINKFETFSRKNYDRFYLREDSIYLTFRILLATNRGRDEY